MTSPAPLLDVSGLTVSYGAVEAVRGIDLTVAKGEIVTLLGANGAGKSSTLNALVGMAPRKARRLAFQGHDIAALPTEMIVRQGMTLVPEGRRIFPTLTVAEHLLLGGAKHAARGPLVETEADMLNLFPILKERLHQKAGSLSGGEQQMLAIARALMSRPRLLMLDEPSLGLAPLIVKQIFDAIRDLNRRDGLTVFLVEQNAFHALRLAHRGYVMVNGRVTMSGSGAELLARPEVRAAYLEGGRH